MLYNRGVENIAALALESPKANSAEMPCCHHLESDCMNTSTVS